MQEATYFCTLYFYFCLYQAPSDNNIITAYYIYSY